MTRVGLESAMVPLGSMLETVGPLESLLQSMLKEAVPMLLLPTMSGTVTLIL